MASPPKSWAPRVEDYAEAPDWFQRFLRPLGQFSQAVTGALNQGLTRSENMLSVRKAVEFSGAGTEVPMTHELGRKPEAIWVSRVEVLSGAALSAAWSMTWTYASNGLDVILSFQGLPADRRLRVTVTVE